MVSQEDSQSQQSELSLSILHGNDAFVNRLLSRNSTSSRQSFRRDRDNYYREPGKVPFTWEVQPGIPKQLSNNCYGHRYHCPDEQVADNINISVRNVRRDNHDGDQVFLPLPSSTWSPKNKSPKQKASPSTTQSQHVTSCFLIKPKKSRKESRNFCHSRGHYSNSEDDDEEFFSPSSSPRALEKTTIVSLPSFKLGTLAKGLIKRFF